MKDMQQFLNFINNLKHYLIQNKNSLSKSFYDKTFKSLINNPYLYILIHKSYCLNLEHNNYFQNQLLSALDPLLSQFLGNPINNCFFPVLKIIKNSDKSNPKIIFGLTCQYKVKKHLGVFRWNNIKSHRFYFVNDYPYCFPNNKTAYFYWMILINYLHVDLINVIKLSSKKAIKG